MTSTFLRDCIEITTVGEWKPSYICGPDCPR